jgi:hypothetical protein
MGPIFFLTIFKRFLKGKGKGVTPNFMDILPLPLISFNHVKEHAPYHPQYMSSCVAAWQQPTGYIPDRWEKIFQAEH